MKNTLLLSLLPLFLSLTQGFLSPHCDIPHDHGSTLQIMHASHPCSPFTPKTPLPLEHTLLQMHSNDKTRFRFLSSLATGRPIAPIAYGSGNPTYIVRASIGTPSQTLLMTIDTSNDAAWIPCTGCVGCSSTTFDSAKSSTFKSVPCGAPQCNQVITRITKIVYFSNLIGINYFLLCDHCFLFAFSTFCL